MLNGVAAFFLVIQELVQHEVGICTAVTLAGESTLS
jgi:hypothetical protein